MISSLHTNDLWVFSSWMQMSERIVPWLSFVNLLVLTVVLHISSLFTRNYFPHKDLLWPFHELPESFCQTSSAFLCVLNGWWLHEYICVFCLRNSSALAALFEGQSAKSNSDRVDMKTLGHEWLFCTFTQKKMSVFNPRVRLMLVTCVLEQWW